MEWVVKPSSYLRVVEWYRHLMLIPGKGGEAAEEVIHPPAVGVKNMGAIPVNQYAVLVQTVVGVACDVRPALQHQYPSAAPLGQLTGGNGASHTGAHNQALISLLHDLVPFVCSVGSARPPQRQAGGARLIIP